MASHSWGDNVFRNFLVWVTEEDPDWVEKHVYAYVNIAGPVLGVAKSMTSLLSGVENSTQNTVVCRDDLARLPALPDAISSVPMYSLQSNEGRETMHLGLILLRNDSMF